jgi:hypothetical protein
MLIMAASAALSVFQFPNNIQAQVFQKDLVTLSRGGGADARLMDDMFRIDIKTITVTFDYFPESFYADGQARVEFTMRPGQMRPVIHFDPAIRYNAVNSLFLNGEPLNFSQAADVRVLEYTESTQDALELQRDLQPDAIHTLEISYRLPLPELYPRFSTEVSDLEGRGNEEIFPTINTPHELARHHLTFRVHSGTAFRCIGSGLVVKSETNVQQWILDTEREMASGTVMFVLLPQEDTVLEQRNISGVNVRILSFIGGASISAAFDQLTSWLPELAANLGPFPMPRGISIFLVSSGGGMEYYGGTITSLWALRHEVFHMYYGCSTILATYRDSWLDEAINMWYELSLDPSYAPIDRDYRSNIVSGRSPVAVGFDRRAYDEGARIMEAVARELGGRGGMIAFLRYVQRYKQFAPFTTWDFLDFLEDFTGLDMRDRFSSWLYVDEEAPLSEDTTLRRGLRRSDLSPPESIRHKYEALKRRKK